MATPVLERVRDRCDGQLIVLKGPEIARRYPAGGRAFSDIDLLTPEPEAVHRSLLEAGFVGDDAGGVTAHHLQPLILPAMPLELEIHGHVNWPDRLRRPALSEIIAASGPSALGVEGILAPSPAHHALIVAAHSWKHRPLRAIRDLLDVALLASETDGDQIERVARRWNLGPIWRTTHGAIDALFHGGRRPIALRSWARHLTGVRDRTVMESHLESWLSPFWGLPADKALANTVHVLRDEMSPDPGETWRDKLARTAIALRHPHMTLERHNDALASAARKPRESAQPPETQI
jgi:Uncharacterised nucleotidyltransferase